MEERHDRAVDSSDVLLVELLSLAGNSESLEIPSQSIDNLRMAMFESSWKVLVVSQSLIDLKALATCIKLLQPKDEDEQLHSRLKSHIMEHLPKSKSNTKHLYMLAEICASNPYLATQIFEEMLASLAEVNLSLANNGGTSGSSEMHTSLESQILTTVAYLDFLKCSYWLPADQFHFIRSDLIQALVDLLGQDSLDSFVHDTLSSLLASLMNLTADPYPSLTRTPLTLPLRSQEPVIAQQLWTRVSTLPSSYFSTASAGVFRTWFQWVSYALSANTELDGIYESMYWDRLRIGLLCGFGEQRKYCLGIIQHSLRLARRNIDVEFMKFDVDRRSDFLTQYGMYSSLFETIVLDRYPNQVLACLPELSGLFGSDSLIAASWTTALLSAALHTNMQDGVRKLVGTWYMKYVIEDHSPTIEYVPFLVEGFLPWATQGSLFSSSLISTRSSTTCTHGAVLAKLIGIFIQAMPTGLDRRNLFTSILHFILDREGKIFQHAIVYLVEGLLVGLEQGASFQDLHEPDIEMVIRVSRLPGLPEIASDLCTTYCSIICRHCSGERPYLAGLPGYEELDIRHEMLKGDIAPSPLDFEQGMSTSGSNIHPSPLQDFLDLIERSKYKSIQDHNFGLACTKVTRMLDVMAIGHSEDDNLYRVLDALWDEAERQEFRRPVIAKIPLLFFHRTCIEVCVRQHTDQSMPIGNVSLQDLLIHVLEQSRQLAKTRAWFLSILMNSLRNVALLEPQTFDILPLEDLLFHFIMHPSAPIRDLLFEVCAAEKIQQYLPNRTFDLYYGNREWHAYASIIDLLNRLSVDRLDVAIRLLQRLLQPWKSQKRPILIISKWKETFQLQAMLLLSDSCIAEFDAESYLDSFMNALLIEPWPRYRYLLEWIIARIYHAFPKLTERILSDLALLDEAAPAHIASLMKLGVLAAPFLDSEPFAIRLITQLIPFAASPKVQIRHEAHWSFPIMWDLAVEKNWKSIIGNPAFAALNSFIRRLDKYNMGPFTIRTLKLNAVKDFNLVSIFQGDYLTIETAEKELVAHEDFVDLYEKDQKSGINLAPGRVPTGVAKPRQTLTQVVLDANQADAFLRSESTPAPLQTKSGFDLDALLPDSTPPFTSQQRPATVILIASLIDNPTNLGGLSRISESFGLEALYINSLNHLNHKDFQATAVTSHKHLPIHELKIYRVPAFLIDMKRKGYEVVAIEQTDRSGELGDEGIGNLPKKCVLVLGSERGGVTSEVLAVVDRCVEIKTVGVTRSLNVQTAGGIAVYEWWREWGGRS